MKLTPYIPVKFGPCSVCGDVVKPCRCHYQSRIEELEWRLDQCKAKIDDLSERNAELRETLKEAAKWMPQEPYSGDWDTPMWRAIKKVRAILAKVEGNLHESGK